MTQGRGEVRLADAQFSSSHGEKNGSLELKKIFFGGIENGKEKSTGNRGQKNGGGGSYKASSGRGKSHQGYRKNHA
nr:MAG TPA: hypothetical protein [Bacteriophage sp.]